MSGPNMSFTIHPTQVYLLLTDEWSPLTSIHRSKRGGELRVATGEAFSGAMMCGSWTQAADQDWDKDREHATVLRSNVRCMRACKRKEACQLAGGTNPLVVEVRLEKKSTLNNGEA